MERVDFFVIRHGETDWNAEFRFQGQTDTELNQNGENQARELAKILEKLKPEIFVTSDLKRAIRTAELANVRLRLPIESFAGLRECNLGRMEGKYRADVIADLGPDAWTRWGDADDLDFSLPGGETKRQVLERSLSCLKDFMAHKPMLRKIAVITHGGVVKRLVHHSRNSPNENIGLHNCVVHHLRYSRQLDQWDYVAEISSR